MKIFRHGDVLLKELKNPTKVSKQVDTNVLAYGELTGHSHTLVGGLFSVFESEQKSLIVQVKEPTQLTHQEHDVIEVPVGEYEVVMEKEYLPSILHSIDHEAIVFNYSNIKIKNYRISGD